MEKRKRSTKPAGQVPLRLRSTLGLALEQYRLARGLGLRELAGQAGLDPSQLSRLERGHQVSAHPSTLRKLAEALQVDVKDLMDLARLSQEQAGASATASGGVLVGQSKVLPECTPEQAIEEDKTIPDDKKQWLRECVAMARLAAAQM